MFQLYQKSVKYRLILYFLVLFILPTSILSAWQYYIARSNLSEQALNSLRTNMMTIESSLSQRLNYAYDITTNMYLHSDLTRILSSDLSRMDTDLIYEINALSKIMQNFSYSSLSELQITPNLYVFNRPDYFKYNFTEYVSVISEIESEDWYFNLGKDKYTIIDVQKEQIVIAQKLFGLGDMRVPFIGVLTLTIYTGDLYEQMVQLKPSPGSAIMIVDRNMNLLLSTEQEPLNMDPKVYAQSLSREGTFLTHNQGEHIVLGQNFNFTNWTIITIAPVNEVNSTLIHFRNSMIIVFVLCLFIAVFLSIFLSNNITGPIQKFVKSMNWAREGNLDMIVEYKRKDEFSILFTRYRQMIAEIKDLINQLVQSKIRQKDMELKVLQSQINPHFLYNTLDSINWLALRHNVQDISRMVTSLSDFFRYSLSKGKDIITLGEELKHIHSYLAIQKERFKERVEYRIQVEDELLDILIPKLLLQPIVENSIVHGIETQSGTGLIEITIATVHNQVHIHVTDNGKGSNTGADILNCAIREEEAEIGFGLRNTHQRLQNMFGEEAGVWIERNDEQGFGIKLILKSVYRMEDLKHGYLDHRG